MIINRNTQLGLSWITPEPSEKKDKVVFYETNRDFGKCLMKTLQSELERLKQPGEGILFKSNPDFEQTSSETIAKVKERASIDILSKKLNAKYFLITAPVIQLAEMLKIKDNFSFSILSKLDEGLHCYLMGKEECIVFNHLGGCLMGYYWHRAKDVAFEFSYDLSQDSIFALGDDTVGKKMDFILQLMTFVVLGDIEVVEIKGGKNNGKTIKEGKIANQSNNTVYVVDSSWNKLIIRTDGFAVKGHFRLQPCGAGMTDRKLIWIDAFEKHGYTRRPRAEIQG